MQAIHSINEKAFVYEWQLTFWKEQPWNNVFRPPVVHHVQSVRLDPLSPVVWQFPVYSVKCKGRHHPVSSSSMRYSAYLFFAETFYLEKITREKIAFNGQYRGRYLLRRIMFRFNHILPQRNGLNCDIVALASIWLLVISRYIRGSRVGCTGKWRCFWFQAESSRFVRGWIYFFLFIRHLLLSNRWWDHIHQVIGQGEFWSAVHASDEPTIIDQVGRMVTRR